MESKKREYAFLLRVVSEHDITQIVAQPVYMNDAGELLYPNDNHTRTRRALELTDFKVDAYLDRDHSYPWGMGYSYAPHHVKLPHAEAMVRVLRRLEKGMAQFDRELGYLGAEDFDQFLFRVARILGIRTYYVHNTPAPWATQCRDIHRKTDSLGVQSWIAARVKHLGKQEDAPQRSKDDGREQA